MRFKARLLLFVFLSLILIPSCEKAEANNFYKSSSDTADIIQLPVSFRDVRGITNNEIKAIESLQKQNRVFIYGMPLSTEAFEDENGIVKGFTALFCNWLSGFFGIQFRPMLFDWLDLLAYMETGAVSFTGELTATEDRLNHYYMVSNIASRPIKYFRLAGSRSLESISNERPLRYGFIEGTNTINTVTSELKEGSYVPIILSGIDLVYNALKNQTIDAFFYSSSAEANFFHNFDIVSDYFFPLRYRPVSLSTKDSELLPIITIMEKVLENGGNQGITAMYNQGYNEYMFQKLRFQLTDEELAYIDSKPVIRIGVDPGNYPGCFYDKYDKEWKGIALEILDEISLYTGLKFERVNDQNTGWQEIYKMLSSGEISLIPELEQDEDRYGLFLWPETVQMTDRYALISQADFPDIKTNEILFSKIGLVKNTASDAIFRRWFSNHMDISEYVSAEDAFEDLRRGNVDMVMANYKRLLYLTHYLEMPNFKANIIFDYPVSVKFGLNINEIVLCSVIDKALKLVDTASISNYWMRQTYDYRLKIAHARQPWFIGSCVLIFFVLILLFILIIKYRKEGIKLEKLVQERTAKLNLYQRELETALEAAKSASRLKSIFLANMSHEIRTPMNSIMGFSELALDSDASDRTRDFLQKIRTNIEWLLQIINDILDISKIESGKMELEKIPFDMHELFIACRSLVMPKAIEKGIILHFYAEPSVGRRPVGDPTRLRQVFVNLLSNAVKFTSSGMVKLLSDVTSSRDNMISMHFEVKDSGIGMSADQINRIFEPFIQGESGTTRKYGGTGLGLPITKNIIEMMGGKLSVESTPGVGSKFSFDLKFDTVPITVNDYHGNRAVFKEVSKPLLYGEVLVCEDNEMNQFVICEHLSRIGLKSVVAENGQVGIDILKKRIENEEKMFDLIFMDMHMPVMDGFEAAEEFKKLNLDIPMVAMTANIMIDDVEVYKASGMLDCLGKPFTSQELWRCLLKFLKPLNDAD